MDSMRWMLSRAEGAGFSSRGVRDGASECSGPGGLLGDPPHWRVARAFPRECVAPRTTEARAVMDSRSSLLLIPAQGVERECPPEFQDRWGVEDKRSHPKNRGSMTVGLGGLGPPAYPIHPHKCVGLGFRKGPWKGTPFRRPYRMHWMRSLARYMNGCLSWRQPLGPPDGQGAVVAD